MRNGKKSYIERKEKKNEKLKCQRDLDVFVT